MHRQSGQVQIYNNDSPVPRAIILLFTADLLNISFTECNHRDRFGGNNDNLDYFLLENGDLFDNRHNDGMDNGNNCLVGVDNGRKCLVVVEIIEESMGAIVARMEQGATSSAHSSTSSASTSAGAGAGAGA